MAAESTTPTIMRMVTATIMPEASPRASDSIISRPIPFSAPMNSPTITPISANEIAGESEAKSPGHGRRAVVGIGHHRRIGVAGGAVGAHQQPDQGPIPQERNLAPNIELLSGEHHAVGDGRATVRRRKG